MASKKDQNQVIPGAIQALLDQRATFQDWLAKLDGVGSDFRPEVAERVRKDYEERLGGVEAELGTHSSELEAAMALRIERLEELAAEHDSISADLEESQLRHEVGEYSQSDWEAKRDEHSKALDTLGDEIGAERVAVSELEGVLTEVTGKQPVSGGLRIMPDVPDLPDLDEQGFDEEALDANAESTDAEAEALGEDLADEADFDSQSASDSEEEEASGSGMAMAAEVVPAVAGAEAASAGADSGDEAFLDELEFLESLSMDDSQNFDAVSQLLEDEETGSEKGKKDA